MLTALVVTCGWIVKSAEEQGISAPKSDQFEAIPGYGVKAVVDGKDFYVGGPAMLKRLALTSPPARPDSRDAIHRVSMTTSILWSCSRDQGAQVSG